MKHYLPLFLIALLSIGGTATAATSVTTSSVSGHWTTAGSPYLVFNDITVAAGTTLTIDAGVEVIVQGFYQITVNGSLFAVGTSSQVIDFHVQDTTGWSDAATTTGGWYGIAIRNADSCSVQYCDIHDAKQYAFVVSASNLKMDYCNLYHNNGFSVYGNLTPAFTLEMSNCNVHDNKSTISFPYTCAIFYGTANFHDCSFYNNASAMDMLYASGMNLLFVNNQVYQNAQTDTLASSSLELHHVNSLIKGNKIHHNSSLFDGAISIFDGSADIVGNLICNNQSVLPAYGGVTCTETQGGGGIRLEAVDDTFDVSRFTIRNNVIANNDAGFAGSAVYMYCANANICNNQIVNNTSSNAAIYVYDNSALVATGRAVRVKNNLFFNNTTGTDTFNLTLAYGDTISFEHNYTKDVYSVDIAHMGFSVNSLIGDTTTNVIGNAPGMMTPTLLAGYSYSAVAADFGLAMASPCINMGDTTGAFADSVDYAGNARVRGSAIDIGAYEYFSTAGTANATAPASMMGVYPNPANILLFISTPAAKGAVVIRDVTGNIVAQKNVAGSITSFDIHTLPRGVYLASWKNGGQETTGKVIVE